MKGGKKQMDAEKKTLYLTVGKEVSLSFTGNGEALQYIRLSVNKLAEIINNGLVDRQSIFEIDEVSLITKSNYKTVVQVVAGKQVLHGNTDHVDVVIDKDKTKQKADGKDIFTNGDFLFIVDQEQHISKQELHTLNIKNSKSYLNEGDRL